MPIYLRVYVFDIQNGYEVESKNAVPVLVERGPYTFFETREKVVTSWNDTEQVSYKDVKTFYFDPELSNGTLDDMVSYINVPLVVSWGFLCVCVWIRWRR